MGIVCRLIVAKLAKLHQSSYSLLSNANAPAKHSVTCRTLFLARVMCFSVRNNFPVESTVVLTAEMDRVEPITLNAMEYNDEDG